MWFSHPLQFAKKCHGLYPEPVGLTSASAPVRRNMVSMFVTASGWIPILTRSGSKS